mgnify:CR=1 FL=1
MIRGTGRYKTASGLVVNIFEIKANGATFNCHGYIAVPRSRGRFKHEWNIWAEDGRFRAVGKHRWDIVEFLGAGNGQQQP